MRSKDPRERSFTPSREAGELRSLRAQPTTRDPTGHLATRIGSGALRAAQARGTEAADATSVDGESADDDGAHNGSGAAPPAQFAGYDVSELLGRGGMGEVLLGHDELIGRDIAIKRMRRAHPDATAEARFLREAKIQARLQHPAIVPVHALGYDVDGRPYFTMKRLAGVTLEELRGAPLRRLLRAFADVCLAIEFAHEHGVIHRDIKPTNIMLGDFGEVYVLDWGIAYVLGDGSAASSVQDISGDQTREGAVMGTPGYMAPEQALDYAISPAVDVYALGCVLFEILTCEPLHPRGPGGAASAVAHPSELPSARRGDLGIAPELDSACIAALAEDPADRPTARELAQLIEDYLDGDRDLERRKNLAAAQLDLARDALASRDPNRRADAVHAAGRALVLDPESSEAQQLLASLIVTPPSELPPALHTSLAEAERAAHRVRSKSSSIAFLAVLPFVALVPLLDTRSWLTLGGFFASVAAMAAVSWASYRRGASILPLSLIGTFVLAFAASRLVGPFVLAPVVTGGLVLGLMGLPALGKRPWAVMVWMVLATIVPVGLEAAGVLTRTSWFEADALVVRTGAIAGLSPPVALIALTSVQIAFMTIAAGFVRTLNRDRRLAERSLHIQAWHLQQLLPHGAPARPSQS